MHDALKAIREKPWMYFGTAEHLFSAFIAFDSGYSLGVEAARKGHPLASLVPPDFGVYVCKRFGIQPGETTKGWITHIQERTSGEKEAFELLFVLLEDYEKDHVR